ncbi:MAG: hypothetical protein CMJ44_03975 [Pimelobacter sp.]|nr:hypothetical protein [Pimelobacter sp.]|tara:strand:+ start:326 stop:544 length:219 start_codon:yes stop_codon:yes gene_type:complete
MATTVIYRIAHPYTTGAQIEVYGETDMGWYEWRVIESGAVRRDTGRENSGQGMGYGIPEIALRDALIEETRD